MLACFKLQNCKVSSTIIFNGTSIEAAGSLAESKLESDIFNAVLLINSAAFKQ